MDRRGLLGSLLGLPLVALPAAVLGEERWETDHATLDWLNRSYIYGTGPSLFFAASGEVYKIRFTGWKTADDSNLLVAQWIAIPKDGTEWPDRPGFYSSTPGWAEKYWPGNVVGITPQVGQTFLRGDDFFLPREELLVKAREAARQAYCRLIDEIGEFGQA